MSIILCIETSGEICSVAVARDGEVVALRESGGDREHARLVANYAQEALQQAGVEMSELGAVAVSAGPGSYTGLRIGVSFAKGLCYSLGIPMIAVRSTESLARLAAGSGELLCPLIDARRMEVYCEVFDREFRTVREVSAEVVDEKSPLRGYKNLLIFGSGAEKCRELLPDAQYIYVQASARGLAQAAQQRYEAGDFADVAYFEPLYLKDFMVTTTKKKVL